MDQEEKQRILLELGNISESFYDELLCEMIARIDAKILQLETCLKNDDYEAISAIAHYIKGAASNLRIISCADIAHEIEVAVSRLSKSGSTVRIRRAIQSLKTEIELIRGAY